MRIGVIGTGYVGLVSGACFADIGHSVICVDSDAGVISKLKSGQCPFHEPGLDEILRNNLEENRIHFSTNIADCSDCDAIFLAVGTPMSADGSADLSHIKEALHSLAPLISGFVTIIIKSTVPLGTNRLAEHILASKLQSHQFSVVSNPEFLREGCAIKDFTQPDRIVVGCNSDEAKSIMEEIYAPLVQRGARLFVTDPKSAELIKYGSNAFLAVKLSFINDISDLCELSGANIEDVAKAIGMDSRIGSQFLKAGPGYGGSCFPKDTQALIHAASSLGKEMSIVKAADESNTLRKKQLVDRISRALGGDLKGKKIAIWGLAFKANTDDMRESAAIDVIAALKADGAMVTAFDPKAMENALKIIPNLQCANSSLEAAHKADATVILTEWEQFKHVPLSDLKEQMSGHLICDFRNLLNAEEAQYAGFDYRSLGRAQSATN